MKRTPMPRRTSRLSRAPLTRGAKSKPLAKRGQTKAKKEARYKAFLSSAAWKRIRRDALDRAGHRCEAWLFGENEYTRWSARCPTTEKLTVHHKTYARFGGDEQPEDLVVLCKSCHDRHHATEGKRIA